MAHVPNSLGQMDIIDAVANSDNSMTIHTVSRSPALQPTKYVGPTTKDLEYYNFAEGQSITTIRSNSRKPTGNTSVKSDEIGVSVYEPQGSVAASTIIDVDEMDIEGEDDIGNDEDGTDFVFDLDALKETERKANQANLSPTPTTQPKQVASTAPNSSLGPEPTNNNINSHQDISSTPYNGNAQPNPSTSTASAIMNDQLIHTMDAQNQKSAEMHLGEETMDLDIPDAPPSLAVVLEEITEKNYQTMIHLLELLQAEVSETNTLAPSATPTNTTHPLLTTALRETVLSDVSPKESVSDYLENMHMAVVDAMKITEGYMQPHNEEEQPQDDSPNSQDQMQVDTDSTTDHPTASASIDSEEKLQGCASISNPSKTADNTAAATTGSSFGTSRLGANES